MASTSDWVRKFAEDFVAAKSPRHLLKDFRANPQRSLRLIRDPEKTLEQIPAVAAGDKD